MQPLLIASATALLLVASPVLATGGERTVVYERLFADGFVANEQAYLVIDIPEDLTDVRFELHCNLHVGQITLFDSGGSNWSLTCTGVDGPSVSSLEAPGGHYYGLASLTGVNGAWLRATAANG